MTTLQTEPGPKEERKLDPIDRQIEEQCVKERRCAICGLNRVKRHGDWCLPCLREQSERLLPPSGGKS